MPMSVGMQMRLGPASISLAPTASCITGVKRGVISAGSSLLGGVNHLVAARALISAVLGQGPGAVAADRTSALGQLSVPAGPSNTC
jgi:hypothetical protein